MRGLIAADKKGVQSEGLDSSLQENYTSMRDRPWLPFVLDMTGGPLLASISSSLTTPRRSSPRALA